MVQSATDNLAGLVHATGGLLNPQKHFWYMLGWMWKTRKAQLKSLLELPQTALFIFQSDGRRVLISIKRVSDPEKNLGVCAC